MKAARDPDANMWFVDSSDAPDLHLEAESLEELADKLPGAILDLLEASGDSTSDGQDLRVESIALP